MRNIIVVDAISTGKNFIFDIIKRGYQPVVLYSKMPESADPVIFEERIRLKGKYSKVAEYYDELDTYEETLEMVRAMDPLLVLPGSEDGVILAARLVDDLGLPGNPYSKIDNYTQKDKMQEALKKYGIRYIRGKIVHSEEEALDFYHTEQLEGCVVKPSRGAGSVGVFLCENEEELKEVLKNELGGVSFYGVQSDGVLLQERITGTEYIVNTASYAGKHRLTSVWKYKKVRVEGGGNVYDYSRPLGRLEAGSTRLIQYAFDVADAIGYEYGAIHGEYMVDKKGPVLIEVNCRPMGNSMPEEFLDRIFRHHETDVILDMYLDPEWHIENAKKPYRSYASGIMKNFITPYDMQAQSAPIIHILRHLDSYHSAYIGSAVSGNLTRTVDLETSSGGVYLVHEDEHIVERDLEFIRKAENEYFDILFTQKSVDKRVIPNDMQTVQDVIMQYHCTGGVLVLTNDEELKVNAIVTTGDKISKQEKGYKWGILDLSYREDEDIETMIEDFYNLVSKIRTGGHILVPQRTYWHMPHGTESIEILCESINLIIEAPGLGEKNMIKITKE